MFALKCVADIKFSSYNSVTDSLISMCKNCLYSGHVRLLEHKQQIIDILKKHVLGFTAMFINKRVHTI